MIKSHSSHKKLQAMRCFGLDFEKANNFERKDKIVVDRKVKK